MFMNLSSISQNIQTALKSTPPQQSNALQKSNAPQTKTSPQQAASLPANANAAAHANASANAQALKNSSAVKTSTNAQQSSANAQPKTNTAPPSTKTTLSTQTLSTQTASQMSLYSRTGMVSVPPMVTAQPPAIQSSPTKPTMSTMTKPMAPTTQPSTAPAPTKTGGFVAEGGEVVVDIKASESGYNNKLYWSTDNFVTKNYIGIDNQQASVSLGKFAKGTRIEFGIDNGQNQFFKTGGATANVDGVDHTQVTQTAQGTLIGFEDLMGGGDRDYNDAIILVRQGSAQPATPATPATNLALPANSAPITPKAPMPAIPTTNSVPVPPKAPVPVPVPPKALAPVPVPPKAPVPVPVPPKAPVPTNTVPAQTNSSVSSAQAPAKPSIAQGVIQSITQNTKPTPSTTTAINTNRSGLADGTNPGQGATHTRSNNLGTLNPNNSVKIQNNIATYQQVASGNANQKKNLMAVG
jgi:hypothetical protein